MTRLRLARIMYRLADRTSPPNAAELIHRRLLGEGKGPGPGGVSEGLK